MKHSIFIFLFTILSSCINTKEKYINEVVSNLKGVENFSFDDYYYIVIIPESGCGGCISEAESFYIENSENNKIYFIFTQISSVKSLKLRIGQENINKKNTYIDKENTFLSTNRETNIYPLIFDIRDLNNYSYHFLNPGEDLSI